MMRRQRHPVFAAALATAALSIASGFVIGPRTCGHHERPHSIPTATAAALQQRQHGHPFGVHRRVPNTGGVVSTSTQLCMAAPDIDSTDPFRVLGLDPSPSIDNKVIKHAYRKLAIQYHPDMTTTKDSTPQEKKIASERFAKINWAYATLSGKETSTRSTASSSSATDTSTTTTGGWTPPHRRKGAYASSSRSSSPGASTDWRDYIPNYKDDEVYDTGGDSFGAIFSDLFSSAAGAAAGAAGAGVGAAGSGAGIFKDFIEFLESNIDGYSSGSSSSSSGNDAELDFLLQTGSLQDIGDEMDETDLVVQQLTSKVQTVQDELVMLQAELAGSTRFTEKLQLEEQIAELESRKKVAENYSKKARKRLLALQTRYKQLIMDGDNDTRAGGRSTRSSWDDTRNYASQTSSSSYRTSEPSSSSSSSSRPRPGQSEDEKWDDGFGSFGRGRGSSRRRARRRTTTTTTSSGATDNSKSDYSSSSYSSSGPGSYSRSGSSSRDPNSGASSSSSSSSSSGRRSTYSSTSSPPPRQTSSSSSSSSSSEPYVPPHRRTTRGYETRKEEDARRLREVKVDEEFDKLKRDLGL